MPRSIPVEIKMYTLREACQRLAELSGRVKPYSRGGFYRIVRAYDPNILASRFTEEDLKLLVRSLKRRGRPKKLDKSQ